MAEDLFFICHVLILAGFVAGCGGIKKRSEVKQNANWSTNKDMEVFVNGTGIKVSFLMPPERPEIIKKFELLKGDAETKKEALRRISMALRQYPDGFVERHLETIHVVKKIWTLDDFVNAMNINGVVILTVSKGLISFPRLFHNEFSSTLFHRYRNSFPDELWRKTNNPDFKYAYENSGRSEKAISDEKEKNKTYTQDDSFRGGFVSSYGKTSLENDFNGFAEALFWNEGIIYKAKKYPQMHRKLELAIAFYGNILSAFTLEYFNEQREISVKDLRDSQP